MWSSHVKPPRCDAAVLAAVAAGSAGAVANASKRAAGALFAVDARTLFLAALRAADVIVVCVSALAAYGARAGPYGPDHSEQWEILAGCLLAANLLHVARLYSIESLRRWRSHVRRLAGAWALTMLAVVATVYFAGTSAEASRGWMLLWAVFGIVGLMAVRVTAWRWLGSWLGQEKFMLKVAVVGDGAAAERLAHRLDRGGSGDSRVIGVFKLSGTEQGARGAAVPGIDDLLRLARRERIDEIVLSIPCPNATGLRLALAKLGTIPISVKLCPDLTAGEGVSQAGPLLPPVAVLERPLAGWPILVKRGMDVAICAGLLLLFGPLMVLVAVLIKLDSPGPVLFHQQRFGFNQNPFTVYKFRTMYAAAGLDSSAPQARRNDPRVTWIGRFLRGSSIDELPQLFNVLGGSMSLVGPRPHAIAHDERYAALIDGYLGRHRVKPGITGWAQVNGYRGETGTIDKMARRIEHDLFYIDHWSPFLDLYILFRTVLVGFHAENAY